MFEFLLPLVGFAVGLLVALTGVGAGSIMTPILLAFGLPPISAVGTDVAYSSVSKALGTSLYWKGRAVNKMVVALLFVGSLAATAVGGYLIVSIRDTYGQTALNMVVSVGIAGILLIAGSSYLLVARNPPHKGPTADLPPSTRALVSLGFLIGFAVNITSIGAGSMLMPYLMRKFRSTNEMVGTDLAFGFLTTLIAASLQAGLGNILLIPLVFILAGSLPGTYAGVKLNKRVHPRHLRSILSILIILAGISILLRLLL